MINEQRFILVKLLYLLLIFVGFYSNGPNNTNGMEPYGLSPHYWHVFAARLAFVVVFEVSRRRSFD
jgi:hypothetical protein